MLRVVLAFVSYCAVASCVYVVNDLMDREDDRRHPTKRLRPIAAGEVSVPCARVTCVVLGACGLALAWACASFQGVALVMVYLAVNLAYSLGLKRIPLLDVVLLSAGYVLRVVYGSAAAGVSISGWLYLTVMAGSFALGLGKRRGEVDVVGSGSRAVLQGYTRDFLDKNMYVCLTLAVAFYSMWARESQLRLVTVPLVLVMVMRYSLDVERGGDGDPMGIIASDRVLLVMSLGFIVLAALLVYTPEVMR